MSTLNVPVLMRRGTQADVPASMLAGELYVCLDTGLLFCGTGSGTIEVGGGSAPSGAGNLVYATPDGSSGDALLRALVAADIPSLSSVYDVAGLAATAQSNAAAFATSAVATETSRAETAEGLLVPISAITGMPNLVLATNPSGSSSAEAALRALVAADIPTLNQNTSGTAGGLSGTPSISVTNLTASLVDASAITGSLAGLKLATPSAPTITPNTSGGGTSYSYKIVAKDQNGTTLAGILSTCGSIASTAGSTSTGQSVLSGSVYNTLAWAAVTGAVSYDVYRTVGGATQGYIGNTSLLTFNDTGLTGNGWTAPAYNTSGSVVDAFDSQAGNGNFFTSIGEVWKAGSPTGYIPIGATNRVDMALRYVSETMIVNKITVLNSASANASETAGFGMYDQNLNLVAHTTFAHTVLVAAGTPTAYSSAVLEATPPTIVPGWYWFAFTSSGAPIAATFAYYGSSATVGQYLSIIKNVTRITRGGNAASAGVLPATQTLQGTNDGLSGLFVVYET